RIATDERVGQGGWVTQPAGELDGLRAKSSPPIGFTLVAKRARKPRQDSRAQHRVGVAEQMQRVVEQPNGVLAGGKAGHPDEPSAVAGGSSGQLLDGVDGTGETGRLQERRSRLAL